MAFDIEGARTAGYSDSEILDHLHEKGETGGFDVAGARAAKYTDSEILEHVSTPKPPKPKADAATKAVRAAELSYPARMTLTRGGQPVLEKPNMVPAPYDAAAVARNVADLPTAEVADLAQRDQGVNRIARAVLPKKLAADAMTAAPIGNSTVGEIAGNIVKGDQAAERAKANQEAPFSASVQAVPAITTAATGKTMADVSRLIGNVDQKIVDLTTFKKEVEAGTWDRPQPLSLGSPGTLDRPTKQRLAMNPAEIDRTLKALNDERDRLGNISTEFQIDVANATPKNQGMGGKMLTSAAASAPPTMAGLAAGVATRSPAVGMTIAGGGGSLVQGASTFTETLDAGDEATRRRPEWDALAASPKDRVAYLQSVLADQTAGAPFKRDAQRVLATLDQIEDKRKTGLVSGNAAVQMQDRAFGSFDRTLGQIEQSATLGNAKLGAAVDAVLEGVGETLGLGVALKAGSPILARIAETIGTEFGQEFVTQLMQTLNAYLRYDPTITLKDALEDAVIAGGSGAIMGAGMGPAGAAVQYSHDRQNRPAAVFSREMNRAVGDATINTEATRQAAVRALDPNGAAAGVEGSTPPRDARQPMGGPSQPEPGTPGDLAAVMADERPLGEIRAEQAGAAAATLQPAVRAAGEQGAATALQQAQDTDLAADLSGVPKSGERTVIVWPDGERQSGQMRSVYDAVNQATGQPIIGAQVLLDDGQMIDVTTADARLEAEPLGEGTPGEPHRGGARAGGRARRHARRARADEGAGRGGQLPQGPHRPSGLEHRHREPEGLGAPLEEPGAPVGSHDAGALRLREALRGRGRRSGGRVRGRRAELEEGVGGDQINPDHGEVRRAQGDAGLHEREAGDGRLSRRVQRRLGAEPHRGNVQAMSMDEFKQWLKHGDTTKPLGYDEDRAKALAWFAGKMRPLVDRDDTEQETSRSTMMGSSGDGGRFEIRGGKATVKQGEKEYVFALKDYWERWRETAKRERTFESLADQHTRVTRRKSGAVQARRLGVERHRRPGQGRRLGHRVRVDGALPDQGRARRSIPCRDRRRHERPQRDDGAPRSLLHPRSYRST
jgi:hypothetical protein